MTKTLAVLATIAGYILMFIVLISALDTHASPHKSAFIWSSFITAAALILGAMVVSLFLKEPKEEKSPSLNS